MLQVIRIINILVGMLNKVYLQQEGDNLNSIKTKLITSAFVGKLILYKQNLSRKEYSQSKLQEILLDDVILSSLGRITQGGLRISQIYK